MNNYPSLRLKPGKEKSLQRFHPWVFSGALAQEIKHTPEGEIVNITDINGQYMATGYVQHGSIAVRVLSFHNEIIDISFWIHTIEKCLQLRLTIGLLKSTHTNCFRLMHGEGDGIPGLIIDFYDGVAVIQCHTSGIYKQIHTIAEALQHVLGHSLKAIYDKSSETLHGAVENVVNGLIFGQAENNIVQENGMKFKVDWQTGQKTGFFLDQRDNRRLLGYYSEGKSVLNTFAYTGGFSVYAMMNGATQIDSVDVSKNAIQMLETNMTMNKPNSENHKSEAIDTFSFFKNNDTIYDIVVLDPPAFAKSVNARHNAIMAYKRLSVEGLKKVKPGGLLFTFSCSQVVDSHTFNQTIFSAAIENGRQIKILHRLTQAADHPVNIFHPEGEYLKGLVLLVE